MSYSLDDLTDYIFQKPGQIDDLYLEHLVSDNSFDEIDWLSDSTAKLSHNLRDEALVRARRTAKVGLKWSDRFEAQSWIRDGEGFVEVNTALPKALLLLNLATLAYQDTLAVPRKEEERALILESLLNTFLFLLDKPRVLRDLRFRCMLSGDGFFKTLRVPRDSLLRAPRDFVRDHQLEFILLHELTHLAALRDRSGEQALDDQEQEFEADGTAMRESRLIWAHSKTYHTGFCELFQLMLFLYLDFLEFLERARENVARQLIAWADKPLPQQRQRHPPAAARFERLLLRLGDMSQLAKALLPAAEGMFNELKVKMVCGTMDTSRFFQLARITGQQKIHQWFTSSGEIPAEVLKRIDIPLRDSIDLELGRGCHPHIWFGHQLWSETEIASRIQALKNDRPFDLALKRWTGPVVDDVLRAEMARDWRLQFAVQHSGD